MEGTLPRLLLRPTEAAEVAAVSRSRIYRAIADGELISVAIGASRRIRPVDLSEWIDRHAGGVSRGVRLPSEP